MDLAKVWTTPLIAPDRHAHLQIRTLTWSTWTSLLQETGPPRSLRRPENDAPSLRSPSIS